VSDQFDRTVTLILVVAISLMAMAIAKRAFLDHSSDGPPPDVRFEPRWTELLDASRRIGSPTADAVIVEVADLQCPGCRAYQPVLDNLRARYGDRLTIAFVQFPLTSIHPQALQAHRAAECSFQLGLLGNFVERIYAKQDSLRTRPVWHYARDAGAQDSVAFHRCLQDSLALDEPINRAIDAADSLGVNLTPTIFLNGWRYKSLPSERHLRADINRILEGRAPNRRTPEATH
jgi:protein-disulfide isomerase